jgi:hypothetical protein
MSEAFTGAERDGNMAWAWVLGEASCSYHARALKLERRVQENDGTVDE